LQVKLTAAFFSAFMRLKVDGLIAGGSVFLGFKPRKTFAVRERTPSRVDTGVGNPFFIMATINLRALW